MRRGTFDRAAPSGCLDLAVLAEIRALGGPGDDVLAEVVGLFLADVPLQLERLRAAVAARDTDAVRRVAHRLKGSALGIGARQMADVCARLEHAARDGEPDRAAEYAATLDEAFDVARAALEREAGG